jgi:hypothetical protein
MKEGNILDTLSLILVFICGSILAPIILSIIGNLTTNPVHELLTNIFGGISLTPGRKFRGLWIVKYSYKSGDENKTDYLLMYVKRVGKNVIAKTKNTEYGKYYFKGNIHAHMYLTGIWSSYIDEDIHNGAFQIISSHYGNRAEGKWIGFNRYNKVGDGPMIWIRIDEAKNKKQIKEYVEKINAIGAKKYFEKIL